MRFLHHGDFRFVRRHSCAKIKILIHGFEYNYHKLKNKYPLKYWMCHQVAAKGCKARAVLDVDKGVRFNGMHNHPPFPADVQRQIFEILSPEAAYQMCVKED